MDPIIVFTDGACSGNPGPGGWAAILVSPMGKVRELGGGAANTTNNRMELTAAIEALASLAKVKSLSSKKIRLYTDSTYVIRGITEWIHGWKKRDWKNAEGDDVANKEFWLRLDSEVQEGGFQVEWLYVPGHSGYPGNERCDEIAVSYSKGQPIPLITGELSAYPYDLKRLPAPAPLGHKKKGKPVYLSYVDGKVFRDSDWKSCEARVKGKRGVKFKKVQSPEEEEDILASWGAS
jgi:ribonuclease HI